jgi:hypothetical protein
MKNKLFRNCAYASTALFLGFVALCAYAWVATPHPQAGESDIHWSSASLGNKFHIATTRSCGGSLVFFNQTTPYAGSVVSFTGDNSVVEHGLTGYGIYFRSIKYIDKKETWWTLMISLWYPVIIFAILPLAFVVKKWCATNKLPTGRPTL